LGFFGPFDSHAPGPVSSFAGSGSPHFQQRGGIPPTAPRSADTKFCEEQVEQYRIIGVILHFPAAV
jgi:hypothetical protein